MEVFKANHAAGDSYAATLNRIAGTLPDGTNMYLALIPTGIEFTDSDYRSLSDSEKDTIGGIYNALNGSVGGTISDSLATVSILVGMYKHDRAEK